MTLTFESAGETTAILRWSASFTLEHEDAYNIKYHVVVGGAVTDLIPAYKPPEIHTVQGRIKVESLKKGAENKIQGYVQLSYDYNVQSFDGIITVKTVKVNSDVATLPVYTHPGAFSIGAVPGETIANILTESKINDWIIHFQRAYRWKLQNDVNYPINLSVSQGELITANWFNRCMTAMNEFDRNYRTNYRGGPEGDIITAATINQLNFFGIGS